LNTSLNNYNALQQLNELHTKCDKVCPGERRLEVGSQGATFAPPKAAGQGVGSYKAFRQELKTITQTQKKVDEMYKLVNNSLEELAEEYQEIQRQNKKRRAEEDQAVSRPKKAARRAQKAEALVQNNHPATTPPDGQDHPQINQSIKQPEGLQP